MRSLLMVSVVCLGVSPMIAADSPIKLQLVATTKAYAWPVAKKPAEFEAYLKDLEIKLNKQKPVETPKPMKVDFKLVLTNTSKETVNVYINGDVNKWDFELTGPGVVALSPLRAVTLDFRIPQLMGIEAGKSIEIPIKQLSDGFRGISRDLFVTAPGEYTLKASYILSDADAQLGPVLRSEAIKFTVEEPK